MEQDYIADADIGEKAVLSSTTRDCAWGTVFSVAYFEIIGEIAEVEVIASGRGVRRSRTLRKRYGGVRWRKLKGVASVRDERGVIRRAELHSYEMHGVGRKGIKIKRFLD